MSWSGNQREEAVRHMNAGDEPSAVPVPEGGWPGAVLRFKKDGPHADVQTEYVVLEHVPQGESAGYLRATYRSGTSAGSEVVHIPMADVERYLEVKWPS